MKKNHNPPIPKTSDGQDHLADEGVYTAKELADLLKIDTKTIYGYVKRGLVPYLRIQSNVRFPKAQIRVWIEQRIFIPK